MPPLAHSARPAQGVPPQLYCDHVKRVERLAQAYARLASMQWTGRRAAFEQALTAAGRFHDLGKLDPENQRVLETSSRKPLPYPHEDAGAAHLLRGKRQAGAILVYSHHRGLPSMLEETARNANCFRRRLDADDSGGDDLATIARTNSRLEEYLRCHSAEVPRELPTGEPRVLTPLAFRIALSCLADADHGDTAAHYLQERPVRPARRRWLERLQALDRHVWKLGGSEETVRNKQRWLVYEAARSADTSPRLYECDSPVGSGKTTAVMAHLLGAAAEHRLRHVFVVLPFTNIIKQAVDVYRKALVLDGEEPARVVAAHHHQADYDSSETRHLSTLWDCPITVTTAVQFFETLASKNPARLRKLHELPGSAVFIDEAHAAIPAWLWPVTWKWIEELTQEWGCHVVLASGSLVRFWEQEKFGKRDLPNLLPQGLRSDLAQTESVRVQYRRQPEPMSVRQLCAFVSQQPGPRLVILNTVQSAAVVADEFRTLHADVHHLSTALTPRDRESTLDEVRNRLADPTDREWTLVATSCVEAGVDLSFPTAVRERSSTTSTVQIGGRANRHGKPGDPPGVVWVVSLAGAGLTSNRELKYSARVLDGLFEEGRMDGPDPAALCTEALVREMYECDLLKDSEQLSKADKVFDFPEVHRLYRVIDDDTVTAVVDKEMVARLEAWEPVRPDELLRDCVKVRSKKIDRYGMRPMRGDELYQWMLGYDKFLGCMRGVLPVLDAEAGSLMAV